MGNDTNRKCPAYGKRCDLCHKPNHFAKVYRTRQQQKQTQTGYHKTKNKKKVDAIEESVDAIEESGDAIEESESESGTSDETSTTLFIDPLRIEGITKQSAWLPTVTTECGNVTFKLDTGAEASVMPAQVFGQLLNTPELKATKMKLTAYGGTAIRPIGTCTLQCTTKHSNHNVQFYIVDADSQPILGLTDCEKLGLVKRVNTIKVDELTKDVLRIKYKQVFQGLGNLGK